MYPPYPSHHLCLPILLSVLTAPAVVPLPLCTNPDYADKGYTFLVDPVTQESVWSHCHFPDPRFDHALCGMPESEERYFVCDPDRLLSSTENDLSSINARLRAIQTNTSTQCRGPDGVKQSFVVAIVLVDRIRVGAPFQAESCENECGEIHPTVNITERDPTDAELDVAMETFANGLRSHFKMGACGNDVIMFYSKTYHRVYTSMGSKAGELIGSSTLADIHSRFLDYAMEGRMEEALTFLAQKFRKELRGLAPADVMLIITMISAVLMLLFLIFYLNLRETEYNAWGYEKGWAVADVVVRTLTGVLLLEWALFAITQVSARAPIWPAFVMLACFIGCLVVYFTTDR